MAKSAQDLIAEIESKKHSRIEQLEECAKNLQNVYVSKSSFSGAPYIHIDITEELYEEINQDLSKSSNALDLVRKIVYDNKESVNAAILSVVNETQDDFKNAVSCLDDDFLLYTAKMVEYRNRFKQLKDEQLALNYELWEHYEEQSKSVTAKVNDAIKRLDPLKTAFDSLDKTAAKVMNSDFTRQLNAVMDIAERFNNLPENARDIFLKMLEK